MTLWLGGSARSHPLHRLNRLSVSLTLSMLLCSVAAEAAEHRARLSNDLRTLLSRRSAETVRVIVRARGRRLERLAARHDVTIASRMRTGAVLEVTSGQLDALSRDPDVAHIASDASVRPMLAVTTEAIGADQAWAGLTTSNGVTGRGIDVAVIDSGVSPHPDLGGRVVASFDFVDSSLPDSVQGVRRAALHNDGYGHGTHVAGIIASNPQALAYRGYSGVAPGAHVINLRVLGGDGFGRTSDVFNAIDWAIRYRHLFNIRILNLSLGRPILDSYRDDPLCQAVERAVAEGLIVVASAGNLGKMDDGTRILGGVVSPGNSPAAITVGALNTNGTSARSDDVMATYSSRGPTWIDGLIKPDLAAPGNRITSLGAPRSGLAQSYPGLHVAGVGQRSYFELSGTSMATAVVSGAAALILEANPRLTPAQVKVVLQLTSSRLEGVGLIESGAGSLNVASALQTAIDAPGVPLPLSIIAGELIQPAGLTFAAVETVAAESIIWGSSIIWGASTVVGNAIIWGATIPISESDFWGSGGVTGDAIIWGASIIWGSSVCVRSDCS